MYLLKGSPGTGKTTLALQFLLAGAERGERALYITLSETGDELRSVAASHGWALEGISLFELEHAAPSRGHYTMYHPSEIELGRSIETLLDEVRRLKPLRVVFDSLSEIRLLAQQPLRYRRQILDLKHHFAGTECTVLLLDDHSGGADDHLESLAHGVIALERSSPVYGGTRRRLEVVKLRGVDFRGGYHDYTIQRGGLHVYPRLVAAEHQGQPKGGKLRTGVGTLDELLGGGLDYGSATLLVGPAGSGKSAIAGQCALAAALSGEASAIYTFDESVRTLLARADGMGMGLREHMTAGRIQVRQIDPAEMSPGQFAHHVCCAVENDRARVIVIDSLTGYLNSMPEERFLLNQLHELLAYLGHRDIVTLLVATEHGLVGPATATPVDVSYLADSVILLRYFESGGRVRNAISVFKKRGGAHERTLREFSLSNRGIQIGSPLQEFQGILTGSPSYVGG
ncbi:MAG: circadian clock protein KaiC [Myxococcota bacterium]|nr:circadian clock protein KaiC [Myxococcota bacterium]